MREASDVLGMRLTDALACLQADGQTVKVVRTCAPGKPRTGGEDRVIRVRPGELTVSAFLEDNLTT